MKKTPLIAALAVVALQSAHSDPSVDRYVAEQMRVLYDAPKSQALAQIERDAQLFQARLEVLRIQAQQNAAVRAQVLSPMSLYERQVFALEEIALGVQ